MWWKSKPISVLLSTRTTNSIIIFNFCRLDLHWSLCRIPRLGGLWFTPNILFPILSYSEEKIKRQCCYNFCLLKTINYSKAIDNSLVWHSDGKKQYDIDQSNELHDYSLTQTEQYFSYIKICIKCMLTTSNQPNLNILFCFWDEQPKCMALVVTRCSPCHCPGLNRENLTNIAGWSFWNVYTCMRVKIYIYLKFYILI